MLLLFWRQLGLGSGEALGVRWYHSTACPPRCLFNATDGFSIINPFFSGVESSECSWVIVGESCNAIDVQNDYVLAGFESTGIYRFPVSAMLECNVESPADLSDLLEQSYTTSSGLLSNEIIAIEAQGDYLGVVTSSGLCWNKSEGSFVTYTTTSGRDVFISPYPNTYLAEGEDLKMKQGEVADFLTWDREWNLGREIRDIWVNTHEGADTVFVATASGAVMIRGDDLYDFSSTISGSLDLHTVAVEHDSHYDWGHLFTASLGEVNIINLTHKTLENTISYAPSGIVAFETQRIYSK